MDLDQNFWGIYVFLAVEYDETIRNLIWTRKSRKNRDFGAKTETCRFSGHLLAKLTPQYTHNRSKFLCDFFFMLIGCQTDPHAKKYHETPNGLVYRREKL